MRTLQSSSCVCYHDEFIHLSFVFHSHKVTQPYHTAFQAHSLPSNLAFNSHSFSSNAFCFLPSIKLQILSATQHQYLTQNMTNTIFKRCFNRQNKPLLYVQIILFYLEFGYHYQHTMWSCPQVVSILQPSDILYLFTYFITNTTYLSFKDNIDKNTFKKKELQNNLLEIKNYFRFSN